VLQREIRRPRLLARLDGRHIERSLGRQAANRNQQNNSDARHGVPDFPLRKLLVDQYWLGTGGLAVGRVGHNRLNLQRIQLGDEPFGKGLE